MERSGLRHLRSRGLDQSATRILKPLIRAYVLGYASSTAPRLLSLCLAIIRGRKNQKLAQLGPLKSVLDILRGGLELQRFPTFCAALVGSYTFLRIVLRRLVLISFPNLSSFTQSRLTRFTSAFIASWLSLGLLHSKHSDAFVQVVSTQTDHGTEKKQKKLAGRTIDLTLFAVTRAMDVIISNIWSRHKARKGGASNWNKFDKLISALASPLIFSSSCALIMFTWLYTPDRLPRSYNNWIRSAAAVDLRLLQGLREFREGIIVYGKPNGSSHTFDDMCRDYKWPPEWADFANTIPLPCSIIHLRDGGSCEYHAIARLVRSTFWALRTYLPLNLLLVIRNPSMKSVERAIRSAMRSSVFLGTFVALFFYGLCLARLRIGPLILGNSPESRQKIEEGINVAGGCALCGWSIFLENRSRRKELGLFVAPRAMATLMPRRYPLEKQWRETLAFSISTAIVFTTVTEKPNKVKGLLGSVLQKILE